MQPDSYIHPRNYVSVAMLAKPFLKRGRKLYLIFHSNPSCQFYISVRQFAVLPEDFLCLLEEKINPSFGYLKLFCRFFMEFSWHNIQFLIDINKACQTNKGAPICFCSAWVLTGFKFYLVMKKSNQTNNGTNTSVIVLNNLIKTCNEGPAVSLNGSPIVSPVTAAL